VTHEINGRKVLSAVKDRLQIYRDRTQNIMQNSKVIIIQFELDPSNLDPYKKYAENRVLSSRG
jgi:hypothetical protein